MEEEYEDVDAETAAEDPAALRDEPIEIGILGEEWPCMSASAPP